MIITDPVKVTEKHPLILEIEVKAVFILQYTPRLSPVIANNKMVIVVVEVYERLDVFENYEFQKQIYGGNELI